MDEQNSTNISSVVVIGAGALGCGALLGLIYGWLPTRLGSIKLIDPDTVELSNFNRQVLFREDHLGSAKVRAAVFQAERLAASRSLKLQFHAVEELLTAENVNTHLSDADYVIDATDSVSAKFLVNDYCVEKRLPFCYAGVIGEYGQLLSIPLNSDTPVACLRCVFGGGMTADQSTETQVTCVEAGIIGAVAGHLGLLQGHEALCSLEQHERCSHVSQLVRFSLKTLDHQRRLVKPDKDCPLGCGRAAVQPTVRCVDFSDKACPLNFVLTKLALDELPQRSLLEVIVSDERSARSVLDSVIEEGHEQAAAARELQDGRWKITLRKVGPASRAA